MMGVKRYLIGAVLACSAFSGLEAKADTRTASADEEDIVDVDYFLSHYSYSNARNTLLKLAGLSAAGFSGLLIRYRYEKTSIERSN